MQRTLTILKIVLIAPWLVALAISLHRGRERRESVTEEEKWLVSDKYCKGCKYYGYLQHTGFGIRCCDYTYYTGKVRQNMPKHCEVKEKGKRPRGNQSTNWLSEKGRRDGRKRG